MAIANLNETLLYYIGRKNFLETQNIELQSQKHLAMISQSDVNSLMNAQKQQTRDYYSDLYDNSPEYCNCYVDYTQIPEFIEAMDAITAETQRQLEELTNWETTLDEQILTNNIELEEIASYMDSLKSMLSTNCQGDFNFGMNS